MNPYGAGLYQCSPRAALQNRALQHAGYSISRVHKPSNTRVTFGSGSSPNQNVHFSHKIASVLKQIFLFPYKVFCFIGQALSKLFKKFTHKDDHESPNSSDVTTKPSTAAQSPPDVDKVEHKTSSGHKVISENIEPVYDREITDNMFTLPSEHEYISSGFPDDPLKVRQRHLMKVGKVRLPKYDGTSEVLEVAASIEPESTIYQLEDSKNKRVLAEIEIETSKWNPKITIRPKVDRESSVERSSFQIGRIYEALMHLALEEAFIRGKKGLELETELNETGFYQKYGFKQSDKTTRLFLEVYDLPEQIFKEQIQYMKEHPVTVNGRIAVRNKANDDRC